MALGFGVDGFGCGKTGLRGSGLRAKKRCSMPFHAAQRASRVDGRFVV